MRYKVKWKAGGAGTRCSPRCSIPLKPPRERIRNLLASHGSQASIEVWNEDETWQIISPTGAAVWSKA
jgi:hypothetical protein